MKYILGVDFSASQNVYNLADIETGEVVKRFEVPKGAFYNAPNEPDEALRTLDNDPRLGGVPLTERAHTYLGMEVEQRLKEWVVSREDIAGIGISVAARTFNNGRDGKDVACMGGNTPTRFGEDIGGGQMAINVMKSLRQMFPETPILGGNDCNTAGNAQSFVYAEQGINPRRTYYITISTGVGGGNPIDDVDEVGHMVVGDTHPAVALKCSCGVTGCLEAYGSGTGIANLAKRIITLATNEPRTFGDFIEYERLGGRAGNLGEMFANSNLPRLFVDKQARMEVLLERERKMKTISEAERDAATFSSKDVCAAMNAGDEFATYILDTTARMTAQVIVNIAQIHDLQRVGIGGGVGKNNPDYVAMIQRHVNSILVRGENKLLPGGVDVEVSPLGGVAVDYGALSLVVQDRHKSAWAQTMLRVVEEQRRRDGGGRCPKKIRV